MPHKSVVVMVDGPGDQTVLVKDPKKCRPHYWKFPGGHVEEGETSEEAAVRELEEETGLVVSTVDLHLLKKEVRGSHMLVVFATMVTDWSKLKLRGDDDEYVSLFVLPEIMQTPSFFPNHRSIIESIWEVRRSMNKNKKG